MSFVDDISHQHIDRQMRDRQKRLRAIMDANKLSLKTVALQSGVPYSSLRSYFPTQKETLFEVDPPEPVLMPVSVLVRLFGAIPDEWLSVLTEPEGRVFTKSDEDDITIQEVQAAAKQLNAALSRMRAKAGAS